MRSYFRLGYRVKIYLNDLSQLFNSMDLSPFHDAQEYIVSWAQEYPVRDPIILVISLNQYPRITDPQQLVEKAIHNHFAYKATCLVTSQL